VNKDYNLDRADLKQVNAGLPRWYLASLIRLTTIKKHLDITDAVLEIGCGYSHPLLDIITKDNYQVVSQYHGVDMCELPETNSSSYTLQGKFNFVDRWPELAKSKIRYDKVVHIEVVEHMRPELGVKFLEGCHELLEDDGQMIFSTPVGAPDRKPSPNHVHEYEYEEMWKFLVKHGFIIEKVIGCYCDVKHCKNDPVYEDMKYYLHNDVLSCIFAVTRPSVSRNCLWFCRKKG